MSILFNNKYRIPSARLQNWNYANEAMYFVTICTKNRKNYFGEIILSPPEIPIASPISSDTIQTQCIASPPKIPIASPISPDTIQTQCIASLRPTEIGKIAHSEWYKIIELRPDMNLELGKFVVMPNHIHGIIIIGANEYNTRTAAMHCGSTNDTDERTAAMHRGSINNTDERTDAMHCVSTKNQFAPQSKNLASIIRGYKSAVTTYARKNNIAFDWQTRFHDHIIRSMDDYHRISNYIINNPVKWQRDNFLQYK